MNYGRFFEYDFDSSCLERGIAVFNYRWLEHSMSDNGYKTPHHPIYLSFTPDSVSFNLHYLEETNEQEEKTDRPLRKHYHNTIIKLYLSSGTDTADKLIEILNDIYRATFPVSIEKQLITDIKNSFDAYYYAQEGFVNYNCFEPESKDVYENSSTDKSMHFLRKVFLDFLYDFEFTDVFKNIPFYDRVSAKLRGSFLFKALMNKTRYYYYRTVLSEREVIIPCTDDKDVNYESTEETERRMRVFAELYAKYEQDWVNSILDKRAMKLFHESPWFEESNVELEQVYWSRRKSKWDTAKGNGLSVIKNVEEIDEVPELNKKARSARNRIKYLHKIGADKDSFALTVEDVIELIKMSPRNPESKTFEHAKTCHKNITETAAKWEIVHYHFLGLLKMWSGNMTNLWWSLVLPAAIFPITACGLVYCETEIESKSETNSYKGAAFLALAILLNLIIWGYRKFMRKYFRHTWGSGYWGLQMPHLLAAVIAAWLTMTMGADLFNHFALKSDPFSFPATAILFLTTLLFVGYEARQLNPYDKPVFNIFSSLLLIVIAYFYSFIVGLMLFEYLGEPMIDHLAKADIYNCICPLCDCKYHQGQPYKYQFIFQFSFFATFIGIFIQLMFRGRPITDSNI